MPLEITPNSKKIFCNNFRKSNRQNLYSINSIAECLGLKIGININEAYTLCKNLVKKNTIEKIC